jgi:glycosyltransferase involved in cell wall biosynthesis
MTVIRSPPLCSVLLCSFNREHVIHRAIESVLVQTYANWELIVVDDGSIDDTPDVVMRYARAEARITFVRHANRGLAASRNRALALARGQWIALLDSDDEYSPAHLTKRVGYVRAHPRVQVVHGGVKLVGAKERRYVPDMERAGRLIHLSRCHIGGTLFVRRDVLVAVGGYDQLAFAEDSELFARLRQRYSVAAVRYPTYVYHLEGDDRLAELAKSGGDESITAFRRAGAKGIVVADTLISGGRTAWQRAQADAARKTAR